MVIYSEFSHEKWWFSIVMLNYQRVDWDFPWNKPSSWDRTWAIPMYGVRPCHGWRSSHIPTPRHDNLHWFWKKNWKITKNQRIINVYYISEHSITIISYIYIHIIITIDSIYIYVSPIITGWWFQPTPLKNDGLRQLGGWHSQLNGNI